MPSLAIYSPKPKHGPSGLAARSICAQKKKGKNKSARIKCAGRKERFKKFMLADNIHCLYSVYKPKQDLHLNELPVAKDFFVLRIDEISSSHNSVTMVGRKY